MSNEREGRGEPNLLTRLPVDGSPPAALEERVVALLKQRGQIAASGIRWSWPMALAAGVVLFAAGLLLGGRLGGDVPGSLTGAEPDLYALLLYETSGFVEAKADDLGLRYGEYSQWVAQAREQGQFVTGEDFEVREGWSLVQDEVGRVRVVEDVVPESGARLSGVFFVRADQAEQAVELAKALPHLRHGGQVLVQKTLPTDTPPPTRAERPGDA